MYVMVTGAAGFIGSALTPALHARGHEVRGASRESDVAAMLAGCDTVVHLANVAHVPADPATLQRVNIEGTRELAARAAQAGLRRFVYASSAKVVEAQAEQAVHDNNYALADAYAWAKLAAEQALREVSSAAGLDFAILRPPLVYGPGVKANFLALLRAVERGWPLPLASVANRRSLIYVGNLVDAIVRCVEAPEAAGRTYPVSDGTPISTPNLIRALARSLGRPARLFAFPPGLLELGGTLVGRGDTVKRLTRSLEVDDRAIHRELGWTPPFSFEEGIRLTAEWYLKKRSRLSR